MPPSSSILSPPPAMGPRPCSSEPTHPAQGPEDEGEDLFSVAPATLPAPGTPTQRADAPSARGAGSAAKLSRAQGKRDAEWLAANNFMGRDQTRIVLGCLRGEEWSFFAETMRDLRARIEGMPATYETEKRGMEPTVFLHYFGGSCDLYITEKDAGAPDDEQNGIPAQSQAFGLADLFGDGGEVGYISLPEALGTGRIELDFHFQPITLKALREKRG